VYIINGQSSFISRPQVSSINCKECRWEFCVLHYGKSGETVESIDCKKRKLTRKGGYKGTRNEKGYGFRKETNIHCSFPSPSLLTNNASSSSSATFHIRPSGLFSIRINLELWILQTVGRTPWTGDQPCQKAANYAGQHKHRRNAERHRCLQLD
jgi:hypothetical protein